MSDYYFILVANNNPMNGGSLQPKEWYKFFDELLHHYCMERLAFWL